MVWVFSNHAVGRRRVMGWGGGIRRLHALMGLHAVMGLHALMELRRGAGARHVHAMGPGQDVHPDDPGDDRQQPCQQARTSQEQSGAVRQGRGQVFLLPCWMGYFKSTGHAVFAQLLDHGRSSLAGPVLPGGQAVAAAFLAREFRQAGRFLSRTADRPTAADV